MTRVVCKDQLQLRRERRRFIAGVSAVGAAFLVGMPLSAISGQTPKIGQVWLSNPQTAGPFDAACRSGLRDLGYSDGNLLILARYAEGDASRFPRLIADLLEQRIDILLVSPAAIAAAKQATTKVPIVCATMGDPVESGLVASLAHPGANLTGLANQRADSDPKRLQLARELFPGLRRVALLYTPYPAAAADVRRFQLVASGSDIAIAPHPVDDAHDLSIALDSLARSKPGAVIVWSSALLTYHQRTIFDVSRHAWAMIGDAREYAEAGALMTYAPSGYEMYRRAAEYVHKILRGENPADLPIEQPSRFELVLNLRTAARLRISVPPSLRLQATEVIE